MENKLIKTYMDGDEWCAVYDDFENLQSSSAGFGKTKLKAIEELLTATNNL